MTIPIPSIGSVLGGKYRVTRHLGSGGMGVVFAAEHLVTGGEVALKWMRQELARDTDTVQRFLREAQASARVRHPNVVDIYDVVALDNGALFLVMELLEGETLGDLLERRGTPLPQVIKLLSLAARGVAAAHDKGIVHRDIKPDNVFLSRQADQDEPSPKVLDFGISKLHGEGLLSLTKTGAAMGTPLYMSLEQLSGARDIDARTDVYAFGVMLYQAVTGQLPYDAETYPALIAKILAGNPPDPKSLRPDVPRQLSRLIGWAMAQDRDQRIPNLRVLITELDVFTTERGFRSQWTLEQSVNAPAVAVATDVERTGRQADRRDSPDETVEQVGGPDQTLKPVSFLRRGSSSSGRSAAFSPGGVAWFAVLAFAVAATWFALRTPLPAASTGRLVTQPLAPAPASSVSHGSAAGIGALVAPVPEPATSTTAEAAANDLPSGVEPPNTNAIPAPASPPTAPLRVGRSVSRPVARQAVSVSRPSVERVGTIGEGGALPSPPTPAVTPGVAPAVPPAAAPKASGYRAGVPARADF